MAWEKEDFMQHVFTLTAALSVQLHGHCAETEEPGGRVRESRGTVQSLQHRSRKKSAEAGLHSLNTRQTPQRSYPSHEQGGCLNTANFSFEKGGLKPEVEKGPLATPEQTP